MNYKLVSFLQDCLADLFRMSELAPILSAALLRESRQVNYP